MGGLGGLPAATNEPAFNPASYLSREMPQLDFTNFLGTASQIAQLFPGIQTKPTFTPGLTDISMTRGFYGPGEDVVASQYGSGGPGTLFWERGGFGGLPTAQTTTTATTTTSGPSEEDILRAALNMNWFSSGGGGGRILAGTGGAGGTSGSRTGKGGGSGGGGGYGNFYKTPTGFGGAGGSAGAVGGNGVAGDGGNAGGGGGWGASGGTGSVGGASAGAAGRAIALNGFTATRSGAGTAYGAVS
jgi:hypothetical protein